MANLSNPLTLGSLTLPNRVFYAPLAGCSDFPFRRMTSRFRPGLIFCEMAKMEALLRCDANTYRLLDFDHTMHPIGGQLVGSQPELAGPAARILEELGFDVIDLNCGCPVDKVTRDGSGSGLLKEPRRLGDVLSNIVAAVRVPVTVKIRAGWNEASIVAPQIVQIAEQAGAKAITIHGRTRVQAYKGGAKWDWIRQAKEAATSIHVIGNGDVVDGPSAERIVAETGCDGVLVARGTLGQPWIVEDILRHDQGLEPLDRSGPFCHQILLDHFEEILRYQPDRRVAVDMRRVGCWYLKKSDLRRQISRASSIEEVRTLLNEVVIEPLAC